MRRKCNGAKHSTECVGCGDFVQNKIVSVIENRVAVASPFWSCPFRDLPGCAYLVSVNTATRLESRLYLWAASSAGRASDTCV